VDNPKILPEFALVEMVTRFVIIGHGLLLLSIGFAAVGVTKTWFIEQRSAARLSAWGFSGSWHLFTHQN
jgi:hypothetical protein